MSEYLKRAAKTPETGQQETREAVESILRDIEANGESAVRKYADQFDGWAGEFAVTDEELRRKTAELPVRAKDDIRFAHDQVRMFALEQKASMREFEIEVSPGLTLGQRLIPCNCAGCYVPGGRFPHVASAIMSVATAKAAGVPFVIACSPPRDAQGIPPAVLYAMSISGADHIFTLCGIQAIAAMAYGVLVDRPADIIVGPGNKYVVEAKRILYGRVGIDVLAGPTEILILADRAADPDLVATDMVSQAEHGVDSPVWLVTDSRDLAGAVLERIPKVIADLPEPDVAEAAWGNYGEVILCATREEMVEVSNSYAAEHLHVQANDPDWWLGRLRNYGSLFLGEECTVSYGDKASGTNHILPTNKAARYGGGLSVAKFIKGVTYQRMTREANRTLAPVVARISRLEGMEGHALAADARLRKYFPSEKFDCGKAGPAKRISRIGHDAPPAGAEGRSGPPFHRKSGEG